MRISDWSSDVCSSDLGDLRQHPFQQRQEAVGLGNEGFPLGAPVHAARPGRLVQQTTGPRPRLRWGAAPQRQAIAALAVRPGFLARAAPLLLDPPRPRLPNVRVRVRPARSASGPPDEPPPRPPPPP